MPASTGPASPEERRLGDGSAQEGSLSYVPLVDARFGRRELEIPGSEGTPTLAGEVLLPPGEGPHPGVLWVGTTGREDRHGFGASPSVDLGAHEITDALAQAGFVVLRFDERGRGGSESGPTGREQLVADAERAFGVLLAQPEVDPDRIVLVGHGEGGVRLLNLAARQPAGVVALALLGCRGRSPLAMVLGASPSSLDDVVPPAGVRAGPPIQGDAGVPTGEIEGVIAVEKGSTPTELLLQVNVSVFLAQGGKDFEVDPDVDVSELRRAAEAAKLDVEVRRYPDLDHLFKFEPGESTPERYRERGRHVDAAFVRDLAAWAKARTSP